LRPVSRAVFAGEKGEGGLTPWIKVLTLLPHRKSIKVKIVPPPVEI